MTIQRRIEFTGTEPTRVPLTFLREFDEARRAELENEVVLGKRKASGFDDGR